MCENIDLQKLNRIIGINFTEEKWVGPQTHYYYFTGKKNNIIATKKSCFGSIDFSRF